MTQCLRGYYYASDSCQRPYYYIDSILMIYKMKKNVMATFLLISITSSDKSPRSFFPNYSRKREKICSKSYSIYKPRRCSGLTRGTKSKSPHCTWISTPMIWAHEYTLWKNSSTFCSKSSGSSWRNLVSSVFYSYRVSQAVFWMFCLNTPRNLFHHIFISEYISELLIVGSHSDASDHCDMRESIFFVSIFFSHDCFRSGDQTFSESHMLPWAISSFPDMKLISEGMYLTDNSSMIENREKVSLSSIVPTRDPESQESEYRAIKRIDILEKVFVPSWCFVHIFIENSIFRIVSFRPYFTSRYIPCFFSEWTHTDLCYLTEICYRRASEYLFLRYIAIHTIESDILREHGNKIDHEIDEGNIIVGCESSFSPEDFKFRVRCNHHGIYLDLIWTEISVLKNCLKTLTIEWGCRTEEIRHNMRNDLKSSILEE